MSWHLLSSTCKPTDRNRSVVSIEARQNVSCPPLEAIHSLKMGLFVVLVRRPWQLLSCPVATWRCVGTPDLIPHPKPLYRRVSPAFYVWCPKINCGQDTRTYGSKFVPRWQTALWQNLASFLSGQIWRQVGQPVPLLDRLFGRQMSDVGHSQPPPLVRNRTQSKSGQTNERHLISWDSPPPRKLDQATLGLWNSSFSFSLDLGSALSWLLTNVACSMVLLDNGDLKMKVSVRSSQTGIKLVTLVERWWSPNPFCFFGPDIFEKYGYCLACVETLTVHLHGRSCMLTIWSDRKAHCSNVFFTFQVHVSGK